MFPGCKQLVRRIFGFGVVVGGVRRFCSIVSCVGGIVRHFFLVVGSAGTGSRRLGVRPVG